MPVTSQPLILLKSDHIGIEIDENDEKYTQKDVLKSDHIGIEIEIL